jgi:DNA-binding IclR family transcriptional regulator
VAGSDSEPRASGEAARKLAPTRLLEALGGSDEPLGKQELLERSGVAEAHWQAAIRELEKGGLIEASGEGRGRRYRHKR